jgi:nicotinamidase-related amidase
MRIVKEHTAALVIDIQERLFPFIHDHEKIARNNVILIEGLKALHVPIFVTEQYVKGLGPTIAPVAASLAGIKRTEKMCFSCLDEPRIVEDMAVAARDSVIIVGIESHVCVLQTAIDLKHNGYRPVVVEDCVSSRNPNDKHYAIQRMLQEGVVVTTYESILFELLRYAGTEQFKIISKLIK